MRENSRKLFLVTVHGTQCTGEGKEEMKANGTHLSTGWLIVVSGYIPFHPITYYLKQFNNN